MKTIDTNSLTYETVILNKEKFIEILSKIVNTNDMSFIKNKVFILQIKK